MLLNGEVMRAAGYSEPQINRMEAYCQAKLRLGEYDRRPIPLPVGTRLMMICVTEAEAIDLFGEEDEPTAGRLTFDKKGMKERGYSETVIERISGFCTAKDRLGEFDNQAALIAGPDGEVQFVCSTVAEAIRLFAEHDWTPTKEKLDRPMARLRLASVE